MHRTASILAVGDELILGQKLDTNTRHIAEALVGRGVRVIEHATVDDEMTLLTGAITRLASGADLLVITGGLGPTADDLTRGAVAAAAGVPLVPDASAMATLESWFAGRGRPMPEPNRGQAMRPEGGECLDNANGTAPGVWCRVGICDVIALPGPPHEMLPMLQRELNIRLICDPGRVIVARQIQTFGLGESDVAQRLGELMDRDRDPLIGTTASGGVVSVRIRCERAGSAAKAERLIDADEARVRRCLGPAVFHVGQEDDAMERAVLGLLGERGQTLGTVESCTGGGLGGRLTGVPGSSDVFVGGLVTYTDELKSRLAGVDAAMIERHGAVSRETAVEMVQRGRERLGCDFALAITGVAGPGGGSEDKPVGTVWIAVAGGSAGGGASGVATEARRFVFAGGRDAVRNRASMAALGMLRLRLMGEEMDLLWQAERWHAGRG
ncbi:MAG: nicotinamide-nucleotide amidase [Phycisphaerales bacterium]|jgi:nicotinamide-nucleotide amidase